MASNRIAQIPNLWRAYAMHKAYDLHRQGMSREDAKNIVQAEMRDILKGRPLDISWDRFAEHSARMKQIADFKSKHDL